MGNFLYRLSTALNVHARNISLLGAEDEVELLVCDWGSEIPLWQVLDLSEEARKLTRFLQVPPALARHYNQDSQFSGVHPINAVARRARGEHLLFSDSDVIIPLASMARLLHAVRTGYLGPCSLQEYFFWASKLHIPIDVVTTNPSVEDLEQHTDLHWPTFIFERISKVEFAGGGVCLLMPREMWHESRGWDERLIYWGWYDIDLHRRLKQKMRWDLLEDHGIRVFHLEHYAKRFENNARSRENEQRANEQREPTDFAPNDAEWGLGAHTLEWCDGNGRSARWEGSIDGGTPRYDASVGVLVRDAGDLHKRVQSSKTSLTPLPITPTLEILLKNRRPETIAIVSNGSIGAEGIPVAAFPWVKRVVWIDPWDERALFPEQRKNLPGSVQHRLFEHFLANIDDSGCGGRVFPLRTTHARAAQLLSMNRERFDLIFFTATNPLEGTHRDVLAWEPLVADRGIFYIVGGTLHCTLHSCGEALQERAKHRGWKFVEVPNICALFPRDMLPAVEPSLRDHVKQVIIQARPGEPAGSGMRKPGMFLEEAGLQAPLPEKNR